ncbi:MAG: diaminopimelate epimerase [Phycisphaerae bacterium]
MRFTKMHGIGNDYVYVDGFDQTVQSPAQLAIRMADRHRGVGGDGLILVLPSQTADVRMRMFNSDGSEGQMCGNGIRCVAKYAYDHDRARKNPLTVETAAGIKTIELTVDDSDRVTAARVDMGEPILNPADIPARLDGDRAVGVAIEAGDRIWPVTLVSMGNPHAVIYVDDLPAIDLTVLGPPLELHELFPERMNVHFVQVHSDDEVAMATWERGSGITQACGTGASAVCVAGLLTGNSGRAITAHLPGGDLQLEWDENTNHVFMTGPAEEVFSGDWPD